MIEFIVTLYTPLKTTINYSTIADLHTLQFTVTHTHTHTHTRALSLSLSLSLSSVLSLLHSPLVISMDS
jgi:hypothetical protein